MEAVVSSLRTKWIADGTTTLADVAASLKAFADQVDGLAAQGYTLDGPVDNGYANVTKAALTPLPAEIAVIADVQGSSDETPTSWEEIWRGNDEPVVALKWVMEGAESLKEISAIVREQADEFDRYHESGWQINEVSDGYVIAFHPTLPGGPVYDEDE